MRQKLNENRLIGDEFKIENNIIVVSQDSVKKFNKNMKEIKELRDTLMTNEDARLKIFSHFVDFFMDSEDPGTWTPKEVEEFREHGENYSECLMGSLGLEVQGVEGDTITVTLKLRDTLEFINEWNNGDVVSMDDSL
jgi:hypothetical protein